MTFKNYLESKHGQIVSLYVQGFTEYVAEKDGRWTFSGVLDVHEDYVTILDVEGDETAVRLADIIAVDWVAEEQTSWIDEL